MRIPKWSGRRGQSLTEFALILPLLSMLLVGTIDVARAFHAKIVIANASRVAAEYATNWKEADSFQAMSSTQYRTAAKLPSSVADPPAYVYPIPAHPNRTRRGVQSTPRESPLARRQPEGDNVGGTVSEGGRRVSTITLEERVALLEREVLQLKRRLQTPSVVPWWEQISGAFADTPAFDEAADLGRQHRASQRPAADEEADVSA